MSAILRRARGVIGTSLTWATVWLVVTSPIVLLQWQRANVDVELPIWALGMTFFLMAAWGAACGALFALIVTLLERRRGWAGLKLARVAAWGAAAGLAVPPLTRRRVVVAGVPRGLAEHTPRRGDGHLHRRARAADWSVGHGVRPGA